MSAADFFQAYGNVQAGANAAKAIRLAQQDDERRRALEIEDRKRADEAYGRQEDERKRKEAANKATMGAPTEQQPVTAAIPAEQTPATVEAPTAALTDTQRALGTPEAPFNWGMPPTPASGGAAIPQAGVPAGQAVTNGAYLRSQLPELHRRLDIYQKQGLKTEFETTRAAIQKLEGEARAADVEDLKKGLTSAAAFASVGNIDGINAMVQSNPVLLAALNKGLNLDGATRSVTAVMQDPKTKQIFFSVRNENTQSEGPMTVDAGRFADGADPTPGLTPREFADALHAMADPTGALTRGEDRAKEAAKNTAKEKELRLQGQNAKAVAEINAGARIATGGGRGGGKGGGKGSKTAEQQAIIEFNQYANALTKSKAVEAMTPRQVRERIAAGVSPDVVSRLPANMRSQLQNDAWQAFIYKRKPDDKLRAEFTKKYAHLYPHGAKLDGTPAPAKQRAADFTPPGAAELDSLLTKYGPTN